jgi:hypothetical protein
MLLIEKKHYEYNDIDSTPKLFIDLDGTLNDYFKYFAQVNYYDLIKKKIRISDISASGYRKSAIVRKYMHKHMMHRRLDYWSRVPMTRHGVTIWRSLRKYRPYVFMGVIEDDHVMQMGKIKWCRRRNHLGFKVADYDRLLINKNKIDYAMNGRTPNILIDDDPYICEQWENAGGIAYYYFDNGLIADSIVENVHRVYMENPSLDFLLTWDSNLKRYVF